MKFYSKRGNLININSSKIINEIFNNIHKQSYEQIVDTFVFIIQEDKDLQSKDEGSLLELSIDVMPNAKKRRLRYNFENFNDMYEYLKAEHKKDKIFPYIGEDLH